MNRYIIGSIVALGLIIGAGAVGGVFGGSSQTDGASLSGTPVTLHKSPTCGCCGTYGEYLGRREYDVSVKETGDIASVKEELRVPVELGSCHTMEVEGYVVEGHVPEEVIQKLLDEKPDIKGIGMPGMPSGSPGMPGPKTEEFVIHEITHEGSRGEVFMTI